MEVDCVRSSGADVCVSIWVAGGMRAVTISHHALNRRLASNTPSTNQERCEYVRNHLGRVHQLVRELVSQKDRTATSIFLDAI